MRPEAKRSLTMDDFLNESIANGCGNVNSEINRIENNAEAEPIQCYSAADLDAGQFEVRYLVESVMVCGQPLILAGPKKCLKTSVAIDLALALATGGMFLGKFPVKHRSRVGFMSGESGLGTIQETARRICDAMGNSLSSVGDRLVFTEWLPMFDSTPDLGKLKHWIIDQSLDVVFVDPAYMAIPGEGAGNLFEMGRILRSASSVFGQTRSTMVLLHHTRQEYRCCIRAVHTAGTRRHGLGWISGICTPMGTPWEARALRAGERSTPAMDVVRWVSGPFRTLGS